MEVQNRSSSCLRVVMESFAPFMDFTRKPKPHNFRGIMIHVLPMIAKKLNVCMEYLVPPKHYIGRRLENGSWTGLLGMLRRKEADMGGTAITMSDERLQAIDPSVPVYMDSQSLVYKRPVSESDLTGFIRPFTVEVWVMFGVALVVMAGLAFLIDRQYSRLVSLRSSSSSSSSSSEVTVIKEEVEHSSVTLPDIFHWVFGIFVGQSPEWKLRCMSTRLTAAVWIFMALIVSVVYRSNLKAMLIAPKLSLPFDSMEEFLQTNIPFMVLDGSMMHRLYLAATPGSALYRVRKQAIKPHYNIYQAAFDISRGDYAVLASLHGTDNANNMLYTLTNKCALYAAREAFFSATTLSIPYSKGFKFRGQIDNILQQLRDTGIMELLYEQALPNATKCSRYVSLTDSGDSRRALDLGDFYGVFCVYGGGMLMAALVLVFEVIFIPA